VVIVGSLVLPVAPRVDADAEGQAGASLQQEAHHLVHALLLSVLKERASDVLFEGRQVLSHETVGLVVLVPPLKAEREREKRSQ